MYTLTITQPFLAIDFLWFPMWMIALIRKRRNSKTHKHLWCLRSKVPGLWSRQRNVRGRGKVRQRKWQPMQHQESDIFLVGICWYYLVTCKSTSWVFPWVFRFFSWGGLPTSMRGYHLIAQETKIGSLVACGAEPRVGPVYPQITILVGKWWSKRWMEWGSLFSDNSLWGWDIFFLCGFDRFRQNLRWFWLFD